VNVCAMCSLCYRSGPGTGTTLQKAAIIATIWTGVGTLKFDDSDATEPPLHYSLAACTAKTVIPGL